VFEDLHWNDSLTLGLLNDLVDAARDTRLLLIVSFRPEYRDDEWRRRANYRPLRLEPLAGESVGELLQGLLGTHPSLAAMKQFLVDRSRGIPFFVEEIVRTFVDTGVLEGTRGAYRLVRPFAGADVPPTVQAVLGARIDALPEAEKRLLQEAAVIGHDAPYALLHAISGLGEEELRRRLGNLQAAEFLYVTQLYPEPHYVFKHSLTHDVAYSGLLHERRRDIHARAVSVMEKLYADRLGEHIERLAYHAARGQLREKAIDYLRQAGAKAADRQAYHEAVSLFEQALEALGHLPGSQATLEQAVDLRFEMRNVLQPLGDRERIAAVLGEAAEIAERIGDPRRIGWVQSYVTEQCWIEGRYADAAAAGERAIEVAERLADLPLQVVTNLPLGLAYHTRGDYRRAIHYFGWNATRLQGDQVYERFGMFVLPSTFARSFSAYALAELGEFGEAVPLAEEALQIAEAAEHPFSLGYAHLGLGVVFLRQGDVRRALRAFERALAAGAFADSPVGYSYVAFHLGYGLALAGRTSEGLATLEETVKIAESKGFVARHALRLAYLGEASLIAGRANDALPAATRALDLAQRHDERANQAYAMRVLGEIALRGHAPSDAERWFRAALALAGTLGMRPLEAHCHRGLGTALELRGETAEAAGHRRAAAELAAAMHLRFWGEGLVEPRGAA
jgi:tetratricopeptide (TPR) repeat protein